MRISTLIFLLLNSGSIASAQSVTLDSVKVTKRRANIDYTSLYKENSELSYTAPGGEIGAPSGYVINGKLTTNYMVLGTPSLPVAFSIIPDFTVRVRTDRSAGVRTPSFRLGGTVYIRLSSHLNHYKYAEVNFTHHSNGQDGDAILLNGTINTLTGNFSTNYLTAAYRFGNFTNKNNKGAFASHNHKVGLQLHKWFNYEPALNLGYGFTRLNYDFSYRTYQNYIRDKGNWKKASNTKSLAGNSVEKERWRFNYQLSYAVNRINAYNFTAAKKRLNTELSANYSLPFMQNVFLMATVGYYGEDPYNIYFQDKYAFARFGLSSTFSRYIKR